MPKLGEKAASPVLKLLPLAPLLAPLRAFDHLAIAYMDPVINFADKELFFFLFPFDKINEHNHNAYLTRGGVVVGG